MEDYFSAIKVYVEKDFNVALSYFAAFLPPSEIRHIYESIVHSNSPHRVKLIQKFVDNWGYVGATRPCYGSCCKVTMRSQDDIIFEYCDVCTGDYNRIREPSTMLVTPKNCLLQNG